MTIVASESPKCIDIIFHGKFDLVAADCVWSFTTIDGETNWWLFFENTNRFQTRQERARFK